MATKTTKKRLTQTEIVNHFANKFELRKAVAKELFGELSTLASKEVKKSGEFILPGIGKIVLAHRKAREGRNPQTGETIRIPAKTVLRMRIAKQLKDSVVPPKK